MLIPNVPPDFNPKTYRDLNPDLSKLTDMECIRHYQLYGFKEGRVYKKETDLNPAEYLSFYQDLNHLNEKELIQHYERHGRHEGRCRSKVDILEKYPFFNYELYREYIGIDMPEVYYYRLFNDNPVYLAKTDGKLYHVDIKFFESVSRMSEDNIIEYITENYMDIHRKRQCCHKCHYLTINYNDVYELCMMYKNSTFDLSRVMSTVNANFIHEHYKCVIMFNVGTCTVETIDDILSRIREVYLPEYLLFISYHTGVDEHIVDIIKNYIQPTDEYILVRTHDAGFDTGQFIITMAKLNQLKVKYDYVIKIHTKSRKYWRDELIDPIIGDRQKLSNLLSVMNDNDIHYYGSVKYYSTLDLNCFEMIGKQFPGIYHRANIRFLAGSIFIASRNLVNKLIEVYPPPLFTVMNNRYTMNKQTHEVSLPHVIERSFGILNYLHFTRDNLVIVSTYLSSKLKCDTVVNNVEMLAKSHCTDIVIILDSNMNDYNEIVVERLKSAPIRIKFIVDNKNIGRDFGRWHRFLSQYYDEYTNYKRYTFTNDSYILTRPIPEFIEVSDTYHLYSMVNSNETQYHYQTFLFTIGDSRKFSTYIRDVENINYVIDIFAKEVRLYHWFKFHKVGCLVDVVEMGAKGIIFYHNSKLYDKLLSDDTLPIIKLKSLSMTVYNSKELPNDFDPSVYKSLNEDTAHMTDNEAKNHFIRHGIAEGRLYKRGQNVIVPKFITDKLESIKFEWKNE